MTASTTTPSQNPAHDESEGYLTSDEIAMAYEHVPVRITPAYRYYRELNEIEREYTSRRDDMAVVSELWDVSGMYNHRPDVPYLRYLAARAEACLGACEAAIERYDDAVREGYYVRGRHLTREELEPLRDRAAKLATEIYRSAEFYEHEYRMVPLVERERVRCEHVKPLAEAALNLLAPYYEWNTDREDRVERFRGAMREFEREAVRCGVISSVDELH